MKRTWNELNSYEKKLVKEHYNSVKDMCKTCYNVVLFFHRHKNVDFKVCKMCNNIRHTDDSRCMFCVKHGL